MRVAPRTGARSLVQPCTGSQSRTYQPSATRCYQPHLPILINGSHSMGLSTLDRKASPPFLRSEAPPEIMPGASSTGKRTRRGGPWCRAVLRAALGPGVGRVDGRVAVYVGAILAREAVHAKALHPARFLILKNDDGCRTCMPSMDLQIGEAHPCNSDVGRKPVPCPCGPGSPPSPSGSSCGRFPSDWPSPRHP